MADAEPTVRQVCARCVDCSSVVLAEGAFSEAALYLRRLASAVSDPGNVAPPTMKFFAGSSDADPFMMRPNGAPATRTTLSTAGCATSGKNVANRNSSLGSPLDHVHQEIIQQCCLAARHTTHVSGPVWIEGSKTG